MTQAHPITVTPATAFANLPELLTVSEYAAYTRVSLWSAYDAARRGLIPVMRHGRLIRIPKTACSSPTLAK